MQCPKCGGAMWDNRGKKTNPKAPDFKCKDTSCQGVIWPPKEVVPNTTTPLPDGVTKGMPETPKPNSSFNTCNAMNNAIALIVAGIKEYGTLEDTYKEILRVLES